MDVDGYRYNYEGFYEKSSYQMSVNRVRMTIIKGAHVSFVRDSKRRSNNLETMWILLEARQLNSFKNLYAR